MMKYYSQHDPKWADLQMGNSGVYLGVAGCLTVCLSMLDGRSPDIIVGMLNAAGCYDNNGMLDLYAAGKELNMPYLGPAAAPVLPCVGETNYWQEKYKVPQHFFIVSSDSMIVDPLTGTKMLNRYKNNMVSLHFPGKPYRLFDLSKKAVANAA